MKLTIAEKVLVISRREAANGRDFCALIGIAEQTKSHWITGRVKHLKPSSQSRLIELYPDFFSAEDFLAVTPEVKKIAGKRGSKAQVAFTTPPPVFVPPVFVPPSPADISDADCLL